MVSVGSPRDAMCELKAETMVSAPQDSEVTFF